MYKTIFYFLFFGAVSSATAQTNAPSIQSGVTFQWSDIQTHQNHPATIESITVNGNIYFNFGVPSAYEMTQLGPAGHNINKIAKNGVRIENKSDSPTWDETALDAFQSLNLNYFFEANGNGDDICNDFISEATTDAQKHTLFYSGGIVASSSGVIAVTERNANNCLHIEFFGYPEDSTVEQSLGETFINQTTIRYGFGGTGTGGPNGLGTPGAVSPPPTGTDYWLSDRVVGNKGTIGIALFYLDDIAPTGSLITKATITAATEDNGDGKMFILTLPDYDKDGMSDVDDLDDDNDGIKDVDESNNIDPSADHDLDGIPNYEDSDFCVLNTHGICENLDFDSDGVPNHFDKDSDNDGITDVLESNGTDSNKDGMADGKVGKLVATMGIPQTAGTGNVPINTDGIFNPDFMDIDADDDGIPDNIEAQPTITYLDPSGIGNLFVDFNEDGVDDAYGTFLVPEDTDGDGIYDYVDTDSDNDNIPDIEENGMSNVLLGIDSDFDGLDNNFEGANTNDPLDVNDEIDNPNISILPDSDGDLSSGGDLDYRDLFNINPSATATIDFDGVDDYLTGNSLMNSLGEVTIMAWIKIDPNNANQTYSTIVGEDIAYRIFTQNGNKIVFGAYTATSGRNLYAPGIINYNEWHHVAGVFTNTTGLLTLYIDGVEVASATKGGMVGGVLSGSANANGNFEVGRKSTNVTNKEYFDGSIDEVRVFNKALSDEQIQQMVYQEIENNNGIVTGSIIPKDLIDTKTLETVSWNNLIGYYPMSGIKNSTTVDYSGNNKTLRLVNITTVQEQTAPMPYVTTTDGPWTTEGTWLHGDVWDIEEVNDNKNWSIVQINNNITSNSSHTSLGLIVEYDKKFTITGNNKIENSYYLELNGAIDLEGDSQLIQTKHSDLVTSASGKILRRQEGNSSVYWYNYWSSPVGSTSVTTLSDNNTSSNNNNNTNFNISMLKHPNGNNFQFTNSYHEVGKISTYWLYTYKNGVTYYDWAWLNTSNPVEPGVGYTQKGTGVGTEQQYLFEGKPNNGTIIVPVSDTGGSGSVPAVSKTDYLLGNPYPSALDIHKFIDDNIGVIDGTLQLWQQWSGDSHILDEYNGGYAQVNKTGAIRAYQFVGIEGDTNGSQDGTKVPTRYLPVGQGFMTEIVSNGNIIFNNDQRIFIKESDANGTYNSGSVFFRGNPNPQTSTEQNSSDSEESVMQKIRIEFNSVDGPQTRRELLLGFSEDTSDEFDYGYEAKNTEENDDDLNLVMANEKYTIQAYSVIEEDKVVPLVLNASGVYNYTIKLTETENIPEDQEIYLRDNLTNAYYNLRQGEPYEFLSEAGEFNNRLEIVFQGESASLSQTDEIIEDLDMYYAISRKKLVILNPNNRAIKQIDVVNMLGQSVYTINNVFEGSYNEYDLHNINTGAYIITLTTDTNTVLTKKIIVK
ncbi:LamG-like jellyroll fold domain-containing protein [Winogradskyella algicola]|uniref:LamG-like jellyroll fold domain-containing protein n=1 Tax=Winogradskyella algicola TaxID=2575815 RepID=UPI0011092615|nr:LamG-like jellyroll fold domain-containing protein [Winogradskyella algicola]